MVIIRRFHFILLLPVASLIFSFWLMFHTFSISAADRNLLISSKVWSDFGSHIPLIRSFSRGSNWPPQYPLYPGEPIRYHYLFFSVVGWLERLGLRLDFAFNFPSALGLASLICLIFIISSKLFNNIVVGLLSCLFFLFNSSFSFLDFFSKHPLSFNTIPDIVHNSVFPSFGPWSGGLITAFWNLNIYTNQRHLGLSFAILFLIIYFLHFGKNKIYLAGLLVGTLILLNQAAFIIGIVFCVWYFIWRPHLRLPLIISLLGIIPGLLIAVSTLKFSPQISFQPGYLAPQPLTSLGLLKFWFYNLGFNLIIIPLGFIAAPKTARVLIVPAIILFLMGNLWRFSPDLINNHKFFNFAVIIGSMYSANLLVKVFKAKYFGPLLTLILTFTLILGGLVDIFPVINDRFLAVADSPANPDINFFLSLPPKSVILNSFWFYHPASLAGRSIYNGYSYFTWSYGYDQITRERKTVEIYSSTSKTTACSGLIAAGIDYAELGPDHEGFINSDTRLWSDYFVPVYTNPTSGLSVYSVSDNCRNL